MANHEISYPIGGSELPDVDFPLMETDAKHDITRGKLAASVAEAAVAFGGVATGTAKAMETTIAPADHIEHIDTAPSRTVISRDNPNINLSDLNQLKPAADAAERVLLSAPSKTETKEGKISDRDYTMGVFKAWAEHNTTPVAFNGIAVISGSATLSPYMNPYKNKAFPVQLGKITSGSATAKNKLAAMGRPVFQIDPLGKIWIGVSNDSTPSYISCKSFTGADGVLYPSDQATNYDDWVWTPYNPKAVKLYEFTSKVEAPKGPQPFVPLSAVLATSTESDTPLIDMGIVNNFMAEGGWGIASYNIASWVAVVGPATDQNGNQVTLGGKYVSTDYIKGVLKLEPSRQVKLPTNSKQMWKLMVKYGAQAATK